MEQKRHAQHLVFSSLALQLLAQITTMVAQILDRFLTDKRARDRGLAIFAPSNSGSECVLFVSHR
jgi:hypothetical protein